MSETWCIKCWGAGSVFVLETETLTECPTCGGDGYTEE
jgi:hypothetical protein